MTGYNPIAQKYADLTEKMEIKSRKQFHDILPETLQDLLVLDVGCGSGQNSEYYVHQGAKVHGIDLSTKEIEMASEKLPGKYIVGDMKNLPFEENTYDAVMSYYALQASDNVPKSLQEMIRVVKPGSLITIITKHPLRQLLESHAHGNGSNYFEKRMVTSYIFDKKIKLSEPSHTLEEYFGPEILSKASLELFEEHNDYPASDQVLDMTYPTFIILQYKKK